MTAVSRQPLTDQVSDALVKLIADEDLRSGSALPSTGELAKRFDVSVIVVREAIAHLAGRGLLLRRQGRETRVSLPGPQILADGMSVHAQQGDIPISDFLVCRAALEVQAAALAAVRHDASYRQNALEPSMSALRSASTHETFTTADLELHLAIASVSENAALVMILTSLHDVIRLELARRTRRDKAVQRSESLVRHELVVRAIVEGDPAMARQAMANHFRLVVPELEALGSFVEPGTGTT